MEIYQTAYCSIEVFQTIFRNVEKIWGMREDMTAIADLKVKAKEISNGILDEMRDRLSDVHIN